MKRISDYSGKYKLFEIEDVIYAILNKKADDNMCYILKVDKNENVIEEITIPSDYVSSKNMQKHSHCKTPFGREHSHE